MMNLNDYKHITIFDGKGNPIPKTIDDNGLFISNINLKKHSVNIPEHLTFYAMEKYIEDNGSLNVKEINHDVDIDIEIYGDGFNLCKVDLEDFVQKMVSVNFEKNIVLKTVSVEGYDDKKPKDKRPYVINILHIGSEEKFFDGYILFKLDQEILWKINLYTETEDEDERFVELLDNIGESVTNRHELIFRNSDINEDLPNSMLLNEKRKEFLTIINDVTPFISSVRGILQIIDFFDYKNIVEVKEYWYNPISEKINIVPISEIYKDTSNIKLQKFGLFYKINQPTEDLGEDGLPLLEDNFLISHQEVLIKLYALKEYFIEKDYGGISDIVDIIGEVYNYQLLTISHWKTTTDVMIYDHIPTAKFSIEEKDNYILPILSEQESSIEPYQSLEELSSYKIYEIGKHSFTHFKGYFNNKIKINDDGITKIGAKVKILNTTFKDKIRDMNYSWNSGSLLDIWWYNAFAPNYYGIQYRISRNIEDINNDGRTFDFIYDGNLSEMNEIEVILPYNGFYDVTISVIGYDGVATSSYVRKAFEVKLKDPNFMFMFKVIDENLQKFSKNDLSWNEMNQEFNETINYDNNLESKEDVVSPIFSAIERWDIDGGCLKQVFKNNLFSFKDYSMISFSDTSYDSADPQRFVYSGINQGGTLQIGEDELLIPDINVNEYQLLEKAFRKAFRTDYQYISREREDKKLIEGIYKYNGHEGDVYIGSSDNNLFGEDKKETWKDFDDNLYNCDVSFKNSRSVLKTKFKPNSLTVSNCKVFNNEVDIPKAIPLIISLDNSDVYGKKNASWIITDSGNRVVNNSNGLMTANQFKDYGMYSVSLTITDINDNIYKIKKNNIINVISDFEYLKNYKNAKR